jgi:8-hydroxy-5-deazaflavin:NADPH oxidoreductase
VADAGKIAVIGGTGDEGFGLALRWAKAGLDVVIGSRDAGRGKEAADRVRQRIGEAIVSGMQNEEAAASCDVIVVTVPFSGQAAIYKSVADHVPEGAVVCDCTVPVAAAVGGRATRTVGVWEGSAAQQAAGILPKGTTLCAGFHTLAAIALNDVENPMEGDVLVCGSKAGKERIRPLVEAIPNLGYVDAGPLETARIVEPITAMLIGLNRRYGTDRSGVKITGLPTTDS